MKPTEDTPTQLRREISDLFKVGLIAYDAADNKIFFSPDGLVDVIMDKFKAAQLQLVTELEGELPEKEKVVDDLRYSEDYRQWYEGFNKCLKQVTKLLQHKKQELERGE